MTTRRNLLRGAALGAGSLLLPFGGALTGARTRAFGAAPSDRRRLIVFWADGGWDVTYAFDPKLGVPGIEGPEFFADPNNPDDVDVVQSYGDGMRIMTNGLRRPQVTTFFENYADRAAVVNGIWVGSIAHDPCRIRMMTGTHEARNPDVGVIHGARHGADLPLGSLDMSGMGFVGHLGATTGRIGARAQIKNLLDGTEVFDSPPGWVTYPQYLPSQPDLDQITAHQLERLEQFRSRWGGTAATDQRLADLTESLDRAHRFRGAAEPLFDASGLELNSAPSMFQSIDLAVDFLATDTCSSVLIDSNTRWDTHENNEGQNLYFEALFLYLNGLMSRIDEAGLTDTTTVLVMSEMTRTPKHNGQVGKDHWQHTSAMLLGAGVKGGRQFGQTDDLLESLPMDLDSGEPYDGGELCTYKNFAAGVLATMDVDPEEFFPGIKPFLGAKA
jgi:hypothetical protein